jgi:hypothetical protein
MASSKEADTTTGCSVELNKTFKHIISNYAFGNLSDGECAELFKDGRVFSHFIEKWISKNYPLTHVPGCKDHDFTDNKDPTIIYDEKTFTKNGCNYCPSNMLGQGRVFDNEVFEEKSKKMIFCIVSNINFPEIQIRFISGVELLSKYPKGKIPLSKLIKFFH